MDTRFTFDGVRELADRAGVVLLGFGPIRTNDQLLGIRFFFRNGVGLYVQWGRQNYCEVWAVDVGGHPIYIPNHLLPGRPSHRPLLDLEHQPPRHRLHHADRGIWNVNEEEDLLLIIKDCDRWRHGHA